MSDREELKSIVEGGEPEQVDHEEILNFYRKTIVPLEDSGAVLIIGSKAQLNDVETARIINELESKIAVMQTQAHEYRRTITKLRDELKSRSAHAEQYWDAFWEVSMLLGMLGSPHINDVHERVKELIKQAEDVKKNAATLFDIASMLNVPGTTNEGILKTLEETLGPEE